MDGKTRRRRAFAEPELRSGQTDPRRVWRGRWRRPTSRGRTARRCRVTFAVFAQFLRFHTMSVCFNF